MPADPHGKSASQTTTLPNLNQALEQSGEKAALKEYVQARLLASGWKDDLKQHAINYIKSKGTEKISMEEVVAEIAPAGRSNVPDALRAELLSKIRDFAKVQGVR